MLLDLAFMQQENVLLILKTAQQNNWNFQYGIAFKTGITLSNVIEMIVRQIFPLKFESDCSKVLVLTLNN